MSSENEEFTCKMHNASGKSILAVCDVELLGKTIKYRGIDFAVSSSFYGNHRAGGQEILEKAREADMVNVVGKRIVELLAKNKLVDEEQILWMGDVPHVQIVRM